MDQDREFNNILVIHFGQLGDVVLGLPALGAIRDHFEGARITLMVGKATADIAKLAAVADDHIVVDRVAIRDGSRLWALSQMASLVRDVRRRRFDLVIDLHSLYETNLLGLFGGIPMRLYAQRENRSLDRLSNFRPSPPAEDKGLHLTRRYLDVLTPLRVAGDRRDALLQIAPEDAATVTRRWPLLAGAVGIFPGAGHPSRKWPLENFAAIARHAAESGLRPAVFLGPEESNIRDEIAAVFGPAVTVVEGLSLPELAAAISRLAVMVGNDSGPAHIAACTTTPIVLVIGEQAPLTYLPFTDKLTVVRSAPIERIPVHEVAEALDRALKANDNRAPAC